MIIDNVYVYTPDKKFVKGGIILKGEQIQAVYEARIHQSLRKKCLMETVLMRFQV